MSVCTKKDRFWLVENCPNLTCPKLTKIDQKWPNLRIVENWPKMTKFASRAQKWYTTGQPRAAFDVRGWQKLPEYALIRIPAGAQNCRFSPVFPVQKVADFPRRKNGQKLPDFRCAKLPLFCVHTRASELFSCVRRENLFSVRSVWRNFFFVNTLRDRKSFFCWRTTNSVVVVFVRGVLHTVSARAHILQMRTHTACTTLKTPRQG